MAYVKLTEYNGDRKETYHFYLPISFNSQTLFILSKYFAKQSSSSFAFDMENVYTEDQVDEFVKGCENEVGGIAKSHTKLQGFSTLAEKFEDNRRLEAERFLIWNLTTRPNYWKTHKEDFPKYYATNYVRLKFSDSKYIFL